ncbi:MAG: N-6 DNA methylase, partial [Candidatus Marinimicrobia bacterium]|nr:N-6 DNA methylase [Candidatus Neomarinimicrobiota bacterium]
SNEWGTLIGMMTEMVKARMFFIETKCLEGDYINAHGEKVKRNPYNFKRDCIEHSLYGVDIDPGAVEIAKLRLWLSLVVDEDDIKNIKPLPNLDYRIMQGNSLISEFMGVNFDYDKVKECGGLFKDETDKMIEHFHQKKDEFLNESNVSRKSKLKEEVENLLIEIFETKLKTQKADYFNRLKNIENKYSILRNEKQRDELIKQDKEKLYKESGFDLESAEKQLKEFTSGRKIKPFFLWNLYFSEVFHKKGGFDVVIANPPYITIALGKKQNYYGKTDIDNLKEKYKDVFEYKGNTYILFIRRSVSILASGKFCTFIIPNTLLLNSTCTRIRRYLLSKNSILNLVNIKDKVFESAEIGGNLVLIFSKGKPQIKHNIKILDNSDLDTFNSYLQYEETPQELYLKTEDYKLYLDIRSLKLMTKIRFNSTDLSQCADFYNGIKTGDNKRFIADNKKDKRYRKIIRGRDVQKYKISDSCKYVLFDKKLLWSNTNEAKFTKVPKIVLRQTGDKLICALDNNCMFTMDTTHLIFDTTLNIRFLLSILNSKLMSWYHQTMTDEQGRTFAEIKIVNLRKLPIKKIPIEQQKFFISLVDRILAITKDEDYLQNPQKQAQVKALEQEIDRMVYKLYELTEEELQIVEGAAK